MQLEHRLSALLQLHLHSQLNTWLQWIGQRQLQDETRSIYVLGLGASYIRELTVIAENYRCNYLCMTWYVLIKEAPGKMSYHGNHMHVSKLSTACPRADPGFRWLTFQHFRCVSVDIRPCSWVPRAPTCPPRDLICRSPRASSDNGNGRATASIAVLTSEEEAPHTPPALAVTLCL